MFYAVPEDGAACCGGVGAGEEGLSYVLLFRGVGHVCGPDRLMLENALLLYDEVDRLAQRIVVRSCVRKYCRTIVESP